MALQSSILTIIVSWLLILRPLQSFANEVSVVTDCISLQDAMNDASIQKILIQGHIECSRQNWQVPVVIRRNVELASHKETLNTSATPSSINWTDARHVVIAERGAIIYVHDLLIYQDEMGVGGLTLAFTHTRQGATGVFTGLVVVVNTCPQPVGVYSVLVSGLPRPKFLSGVQRTQSIGNDVLLVQDVAIWWPNLNSLWQLCNSIFVCVDNYKGKIPIRSYFNSGLVSDSCNPIGGTETAVDSLVAEVEGLSSNIIPSESEEEEDNKSSGVTTTVVVLVFVVGVLVTITALLSFFLYSRCATFNNFGSPSKDKSSLEEASSRNGENSSSRYLGNGNEMSINLFSEGINVPLKDVKIGSLLGKGSFGRVYKGTWKGSPVAIKIIEHGETLLQNSLKLPFEAYLSRNVSHPNVVQTFLVYTQPKDSPRGLAEHTLDLHVETPSSGNGGVKEQCNSSQDIFSNIGHNGMNNPEGELFNTWLVLEFCDKGSLAKAVKKGLLNQENSTEPLLDHVLLSALDVANAMNYLHSLEITHGDLKADNVLLKRATSDRRGFFCKVSDFGLSKFVGKEDYVQTFTYGTITHMPPELLKDGCLSTAVDVYSFGMFLWELLAKLPPYPGKNHGDIMMTVVSEGRRPHITDDYPQMYADLIRDCWKQKPSDRPKFMEIVKRLKRMLADLEIGNTRLRNMENPRTPRLGDTNTRTAHNGASRRGLRVATSHHHDKRRIHPSGKNNNSYFSTMPASRTAKRSGSLTTSLPIDVVFESRTSSFNLSSRTPSSPSISSSCNGRSQDTIEEWDDYHSSPLSMKSESTNSSLPDLEEP